MADPVTPAAPAASAPAPASDPAPAPAPAPSEAAPTPVAPEEGKPESTPSLLASADVGKRSDAPKPTDAPPAEAPKPAATAEAPPPAKEQEAKPAEPPKAEAPPAPAESTEPPKEVPLPTYEPYKVREGFELHADRLGDFNSVLGKFEREAGADHGKVQALGQQLVDFYQAEMDRIGTEVKRYQDEVWGKVKEKRINELKTDPQLGGTPERLAESLGNAKYVLEYHGGLKPNQFKKMMAKLDAGGIGNDVNFVRLLNNISNKLKAPEQPPAGKPPNPDPNARKERGKHGWYDRVDGSFGTATGS